VVSSTAMRVAAWQCPPGPLDVAGNLRRLDAACARAAAQRVDVLVTPEMFTSGYAITHGEVLRFAQHAGGPTETAVAEIARRHGIAIVFGHPELADTGAANTGRAGDGTAYNAATMIGPDGVVRGRHRKVHLYGDVDRGQFVANPARPAAFGFGESRVGMLICYDVEFPESVRALALDGAKIVLVPTANMTGAEHVQEILVRARACENDCCVVYANYCGADDVFEYNGLSMICGPRGQVLAQAGTEGEHLVIADLPTPQEPGSPPAETYLADRRPDLYDR
jgi:5-aminopentanamidase